MELNSGEQPRRRVVDTSNREARRAIQGTLAQFEGWRLDLARFSAQAERPLSEPARKSMLERCAGIENELLDARTDLIISLAHTPRKVAGHSRVVDVERALDSIEMDIAKLRGRLLG